MVRPVIFLVIVIAVAAIGHTVILGSPVAHLKSAPPLTGVLSQSLGPVEGGSTLRVSGKDYIVRNISYFENNDWAIASVTQGRTSNAALLILQKIDGLYQPMLGPGTSFSGSYLQSLPTDVSKYLVSQGVIYESAS